MTIDNPIELAVAYAALNLYLSHLISYRSTHPEPDFKLDKEIEITKTLIKKAKDDYVKAGMPLDTL